LHNKVNTDNEINRFALFGGTMEQNEKIKKTQFVFKQYMCLLVMCFYRSV